jgi:hypothetical protein
LHAAAVAQLVKLALEHAHAVRDHAPVELNLLLAGSAGLAQPAALAFEVRPAAYQARRQVLQQRQLDLQRC